MLVGGKMTEVHLRVLLKVIRGANEDEFVTHWEANTLPKVKLSGPEIAVKETLYDICGEACAKVGLLTAGRKAA